ncbi:YdeI/OmpD-associated family protein [Candidatus Uhrbacteria bacterium]|nr:YdeI/OmpD-associated family protein [Candidatus Uhrbacteria bacterium]
MTSLLVNKELPVKAFSSSQDFRLWLKKNHAKSDGIWLRFYKKHSGKKTITYDEALDEALCFGWIDSQKKSYDADSFIQRFSPRRSRSIWSERNTLHIERLIKDKRMMASGFAQVEQAKKDGRFAQAYASQRNAVIPADLHKEIDSDPKLKSFVASLSRSNVHAISFRLHTAKKPETRERRFRLIMEMLKRGEAFY